jgi:hypothetical protein
MDSIDNTILWIFHVYIIFKWKLTHSPLICAPLRAKVETHRRSSPLNLFGGDGILRILNLPVLTPRPGTEQTRLSFYY